MAELAVVFPAFGAIAVSLLRRHPPVALAFGVVSLAGVLIASLGLAQAVEGLLPPDMFHSLPPGRAILAVTCVSGALAVVLVPPHADRVPVLASVLVGIAAVAALVALVDPVLIAIVVILLAALHSVLPGFATFGSRLRAPMYGALLILFGSLAAAGTAAGNASGWLPRVAGVALVLGVTAVIGVVPYLRRLDPLEPTPASPLVWLGFLGPALAVILVTRIAATLPSEAGPGYAAVLLGLGIVNVVMGAVGAWRAAGPADLWRHSFVADWGLILVGLGLLNGSSTGGAYLLMFGILLLRLPLYLLARPALVAGEPPARAGAFTIVLAAALAGGAPFAGFPARLLLLRGASQTAWPVALVLVAALLAWLPLSLNVARTMGRPTGRMIVAAGLVLLLNGAAGLYPAPILALFASSPGGR
ncbi:MAG: hypothetical protein M3010_10565 [Candidatus Dormibacteraeota bacterium]|nr:hypothetical protein [Candidatus Dormibacteraeota bacterium]